MVGPIESDAATSLANRSATGAIWLVAGRLAARAIDLVSLVVLARILHPQDFGKVAIAMTLVNVLDAIIEVPVTQALVRAPSVRRPDLDTAFTLALIRGLGLALVVALIAWPYARFNADPELLPLVCALGLAPALRGLASPAMIHYVRRMDFRFEFMLDGGAKLTALVVATTLAVFFESYWAIAAATLTNSFAVAVGSYLLAPHAPRLTLSQWATFRSIVFWHTGSQTITAVNWQVDRLLLGHFVPQRMFGLYAVSLDIASLPNQAILSPVWRTLVPGFAMVAADADRLARACRKATAAVLLIGAPIFTGLALLAAPAVEIVLGAAWRDAASMLALFSLGHVVGLYSVTLAPLAISLDRFDAIFLQNMLVLCFKAPAFLLGLHAYGLEGAVFAYVASQFVTALVAMALVQRLIGLSLFAQIIAAWRTAAGLAVMSAVVLPLAGAMSGMEAGLLLFAHVAAAVLAGALAFTLVVFSLWHLSGRPAGGEALIHDRARALATLAAARLRRRRGRPLVLTPGNEDREVA